MLKAYFDDSGTHSGAPIVVLGGLVGVEAQWDHFASAWSKQLANPLPECSKPRLTMFHMSQCASSKEQFEHYSYNEQLLVAQHFREIIRSTGLAITAAAIDVTAWDNLVKGAAREKFGSALEMCFKRCLDRVRNYAFENNAGQIEVVSDAGIKNRLNGLANLYMERHYNTNTDFRISFENVKSVLPLQGADIIATQMNWLAQKELDIHGKDETRDLSFRKKFASAPAEGVILDRVAIQKLLSDMSP